MTKKKSLPRRLLPWIIVLMALAALMIFVFIPIYAPRVSKNVNEPIIYAYDGSTAPVTMENEKLLFSLDPKTTQFSLTDKASGFTWYSNPTDIDSDPIALKTEKERMQSTILMTYSTTAGIVTIFNNYNFSIENGVYEVIKQDDGSVRVNYTIGKVQKTYYIPMAVPVARMDELTATMTKSEKRKATDAYRKVDLNKLKANDDRAALIATYPSLEEGPMYILRDGTAEHMRKKLQGYFEAVGYTSADYYKDMEYIAGTESVETAVFNVSMIYRLEGGDFIAEIPYDEIRFNDAYPITDITPLPYFGAANADAEGYMLLPDGGGAIIRYNNGKLSQNKYYADVYGWDYGMARREVVNETRINFPMFAMTNGGNSFMCMLEGNESYGGIQADINGRGNNYNTASAKYRVLHGDKYDVSTKTNNLVYMFEELPPSGSIRQRYRLLQTSSYAEMAAEYREYLKARYPALADGVASPDMPITVKMPGAIDKTQQRMGIPTSIPIPLTTYEQASDIIGELTGAGVKNLKVRYTDWANGGEQQQVLTSVRPLWELGSEKELKALLQSSKENGVDLYLDGVTCFAYDSDIFDDFMVFRDAARYTTREKVFFYPYSSIWYTQMRWRDRVYLVKPEYAQKCASNLVNAIAKLGGDCIAFRDVGYILSADYNPNALMTREMSKSIQSGIMAEAKTDGRKLNILGGNIYSLEYADLITDMDLRGANYSIFDETVPFFQIALHGLIDYSGLCINLTGDYTEQLLLAAEYGAGLNFTFMAEDPNILQDSFYSNYFAAGYYQWREKALKLIADYQRDMAGLNSIRIAAHERLSGEVSVTTYENGVRVYVNYGDTRYTHNGVTVEARSYAVTGGQ